MRYKIGIFQGRRNSTIWGDRSMKNTKVSGDRCFLSKVHVCLFARCLPNLVFQRHLVVQIYPIQRWLDKKNILNITLWGPLTSYCFHDIFRHVLIGNFNSHLFVHMVTLWPSVKAVRRAVGKIHQWHNTNTAILPKEPKAWQLKSAIGLITVFRQPETKELHQVTIFTPRFYGKPCRDGRQSHEWLPHVPGMPLPRPPWMTEKQISVLNMLMIVTGLVYQTHATDMIGFHHQVCTQMPEKNVVICFMRCVPHSLRFKTNCCKIKSACLVQTIDPSPAPQKTATTGQM